jgi:TolA-binding protein
MMYREAKDQDKQLQILAELSGKSKAEVIKILIQNGEKLSDKEVGRMHKQLDKLNAKIVELEKEYREIAQTLEYRKIRQEETNSANKTA